MKENGIPMRVDPLFYALAKEMVEKNPELNQRKFTKNLAKKKLIIGELMFNPDFEEQLVKRLQQEQEDLEAWNNELKKRLFL